MKKNKTIYAIIASILVLAILFVIFIFTQDYKIISSSNNVDIYNVNRDIDKKFFNNEIQDVTKEPASYTAAIPIFMYHMVRDDTGDYEYPENMVKISNIEEQLKYINENGYESIFMTELDCLYKYEKPIAINFDDGWICVYQNAFPLLKKYNVKSTIFVIKNLIGKPGYCTIEQLHEMQDSGIVDIQIHTVTHPRLAILSKEKIKQEIEECKIFIEQEFDKDATILCYPYGSYNDNVIKAAKDLGCTYGLAMTGGVYYTNITKNKFMIPRIYANRSMNIKEYISYLEKSNVHVEW